MAELSAACKRIVKELLAPRHTYQAMEAAEVSKGGRAINRPYIITRASPDDLGGHIEPLGSAMRQVDYNTEMGRE